MKKHLEIDLPWPPRGLSPNARLTVFAKARLFKQTKAFAAMHTHKALRERRIFKVDLPKDGRMNLTLVCTPPINRYRDEDNLIANCKATFDGIASALRIDDHLFHFREQQWHDASKPGKLKVKLDWEEANE